MNSRMEVQSGEAFDTSATIQSAFSRRDAASSPSGSWAVKFVSARRGFLWDRRGLGSWGGLVGGRELPPTAQDLPGRPSLLHQTRDPVGVGLSLAEGVGQLGVPGHELLGQLGHLRPGGVDAVEKDLIHEGVQDEALLLQSQGAGNTAEAEGSGLRLHHLIQLQTPRVVEGGQGEGSGPDAVLPDPGRREHLLDRQGVSVGSGHSSHVQEIRSRSRGLHQNVNCRC